MVISVSKKYIFIDVPKTATTSIIKYLLSIDSTATNRQFEIDTNKFGCKDHVKYYQLEKLMDVHLKEFKTFAIIRHPYSRIVSGYHFYKQGGKPKLVGNMKPSFALRIRIKIAQLLPFKLWAILYPYKSNLEFLLGDNGDNKVNHIGIFENLPEDLYKILDELHIDRNEVLLPVTNKSNHESFEKYFKSSMFKWIIYWKVKRDLKFYNSINEKGV
jgi:hypothetical protein